MDLPAIKDIVSEKGVKRLQALEGALDNIQKMNAHLKSLGQKKTKEELLQRPLEDLEKLPLGAVPFVVDETVAMRGFNMEYGTGKKLCAPEALFYTSDFLDSLGALVLGVGRSSEFSLSARFEGAEAPLNPVNLSKKSTTLGGAATAVYVGMAKLALGFGQCMMKYSAAQLGLFSLTPSLCSFPFHPRLSLSSTRHLGFQRPTLVSKNYEDLAFFVKNCLIKQDDEVKKSWKLGWYADFGGLLPLRQDQQHQECNRLKLERAGLHLESVSLEVESSFYAHIAKIIACESYIPIVHQMESCTAFTYQELKPTTKAWLEYAKEVQGVSLAYAIYMQKHFSSEIAKVLDDCDFLITPTIPFLEEEIDLFTGFSHLPPILSRALGLWGDLIPFLFQDYPSAIVPLRADQPGNTNSIQVIGKRGKEGELMTFVDTVQKMLF